MSTSSKQEKPFPVICRVCSTDNVIKSGLVHHVIISLPRAHLPRYVSVISQSFPRAYLLRYVLGHLTITC